MIIKFLFFVSLSNNVANKNHYLQLTFTSGDYFNNAMVDIIIVLLSCLNLLLNGRCRVVIIVFIYIQIA